MVNYIAGTVELEHGLLSSLHGMGSSCLISINTLTVYVMQVGNMDHSLDIYSCKVRNLLVFSATQLTWRQGRCHRQISRPIQVKFVVRFSLGLVLMCFVDRITAVQAVTCSHPNIIERAVSGNASGRCVLWAPADLAEP